MVLPGNPTGPAKPLLEAERALRRSIAGNPHDAEAYHQLGTVLHRMRRLWESREAFQRACELRPSSAQSHHNLGIVYAELNQVEEAERTLHAAIHIDPDFIEARANLAGLLNREGRFDEAITTIREAIAIAPGAPELHGNLGLLLLRTGRHDEAAEFLRHAISIDGGIARLHHALGNVERSRGRWSDSVAAYRQAIALEPGNAAFLCSLGTMLFRDGHWQEAEALFTRAATVDPGGWMAPFYLGVIADCKGDPEIARRFFEQAAGNGADEHGAIESWRHLDNRRGDWTRNCRTPFHVLDRAIDAAPEEGLVMEFGVFNGASIRFIASRVDGTVHGFDSFQGIPEPWAGDPAGTYSTGGELPQVPDNVRLHVGWFDEVLPDFLTRHDGPARFVNIDCDTYGSTRTVLDALGTRIMPGTVIAFDEYFMYQGWEEGEFKAFQEAADANDWRYEYLAFELHTRQVAVRILE